MRSGFSVHPSRRTDDAESGLFGEFTHKMAARANRRAQKIREDREEEEWQKSRERWPTPGYEALSHPGWIRVAFVDPAIYKGEGTHFLGSFGSVSPLQTWIDPTYGKEDSRRYILRRAREWRIMETGERRKLKNGEWFQDFERNFVMWTREEETSREYYVLRCEE